MIKYENENILYKIHFNFLRIFFFTQYLVVKLELK